MLDHSKNIVFAKFSLNIQLLSYSRILGRRLDNRATNILLGFEMPGECEGKQFLVVLDDNP